MSSDQTQQQSSEELRKAKRRSLESNSPPAEVAGYTIQSRIGSGAYGEVWLAIDRRTGRRVAIKFYNRRANPDVALLSREVEKLVFLSADRYVVQLLDVGWDAEPPHYVMDYIERGSLEDELNRCKTMPVEQAVELFEEIAIGLMHLHGKGILHCDLKPGNVLLDQDLKPRLADFGQSRLSHEQAPSLGTLFFMAPEQADLSAAPDARWDVYALGALLYCMLTGKPPYRDDELTREIENNDEIEGRLACYRTAIQQAPKPAAHRSIPGMDRQLAEIIDRCITANPKKRYQSVQSVLLALRQRQVIHARRPLIVLGVIGPLLLMAAMSTFAWNAYWRAINQSDRAITQQATESNHWAALLAARSASEQIDQYFSAVTRLAADAQFVALMERVLQDPAVQQMRLAVTDPQENDNSELDPVRQQLVDNSVRQQLQLPLEDLLGDGDLPPAASWFICDNAGTQIASVFSHENPKNTIGKNYSFRSYFHGPYRNQAQDAVLDGKYQVSADPQTRTHIDQPYLSGIFLSQATNRWKVAFSAPVFSADQFLGIVAVTVDMGNLVEFDNRDAQYVMLVDGRPGKHQGTVLEHPLFTSLVDRSERLPQAFTERRVDISAIGPETPFFHDPLSGEPQGREFDRIWIAASADVQWTKEARAREKPVRDSTGMVVIAVEDYASVIDPSHQLGRQLFRLGAVALVVFLLLTLGLLWIVVNSLRKAEKRLAQTYAAADGSSVGDSDSAQGRLVPGGSSN